MKLSIHQEKHVISSFRRLKLDQKLRYIFAAAIAVMLVLFLVSFFLISFSSIHQQAEQLASAQVNTLAQNCAVWFKKLQMTAISLNLDENIQAYCSLSKEQSDSYYSLFNNVRNTLTQALNMNDDISFLAAISHRSGLYTYHGWFSLSETQLRQCYHSLEAAQKPASVRGVLNYVYLSNAFNRHENGFIMIHPIFSLEKVNRQIGTLYFYLSEDTILSQTIAENNVFSNTMLADCNGNILISSITEENSTPFQLSANSGFFKNGSREYFYQKLDKWNFYVLCEISLSSLIRPLIPNMIWIALAALVLLLSLMILVRKLVTRSFEPLKTVVDAMDHVEKERLDYRIRLGSESEDFRALEEGYNRMMDTITILMERERQEQHQMEQLQRNALQSQIQPHFLYNTLDGIHWQAKMENAPVTSQMVLDLANYYRICLSQGKDVITLREELEHIRLYIQIQRRRYGDIISYQCNIPENLMDLMIPKLTLQPLVENSIYHGIRVKEGLMGEITISARSDGYRCVIEETDNGMGMSREDFQRVSSAITDFSQDFGYGIRNVNRRIELIFGVEYGLRYRQNQSGGITAAIILPIRFDSGNLTNKTNC